MDKSWLGMKGKETESMVGLIIVSHGDFGKTLARSAALIVGECENIITLSLERDDNADELHTKLLESIRKADKGEGVVIFTDVLGGTPSNLATLAARKHNLYCMTGVNLPMVIEFAMSCSDGLSLEELVERCYEAGTVGIRITNKI